VIILGWKILSTVRTKIQLGAVLYKTVSTPENRVTTAREFLPLPDCETVDLNYRFEALPPKDQKDLIAYLGIQDFS
jgi:hypothetical protein